MSTRYFLPPISRFFLSPISLDWNQAVWMWTHWPNDIILFVHCFWEICWTTSHFCLAQIKVKTKKDNVAGVNLPNFEAFQVQHQHQIIHLHKIWNLSKIRTGRIPMSWLVLQREDSSSKDWRWIQLLKVKLSHICEWQENYWKSSCLTFVIGRQTIGSHICEC